MRFGARKGSVEAALNSLGLHFVISLVKELDQNHPTPLNSPLKEAGLPDFRSTFLVLAAEETALRMRVAAVESSEESDDDSDIDSGNSFEAEELTSTVLL
jgi:hypothetical protein